MHLRTLQRNPLLEADFLCPPLRPGGGRLSLGMYSKCSLSTSDRQFSPIHKKVGAGILYSLTLHQLGPGCFPSPPERDLWHSGLGPVPCPFCSRAWNLSLRGSKPASFAGAGSLLYPSPAPLRPFSQFPWGMWLPVHSESALATTFPSRPNLCRTSATFPMH